MCYVKHDRQEHNRRLVNDNQVDYVNIDRENSEKLELPIFPVQQSTGLSQREWNLNSIGRQSEPAGVCRQRRSVQFDQIEERDQFGCGQSKSRSTLESGFIQSTPYNYNQRQRLMSPSYVSPSSTLGFNQPTSLGFNQPTFHQQSGGADIMTRLNFPISTAIHKIGCCFRVNTKGLRRRVIIPAKKIFLD